MNATHTSSRLNLAARIRRLALGGTFIGIVMAASGPLGYLTLLALLAVYPILTAMIGEDFLDILLGKWEGGYEGQCLHPSTRVGLLLLGGVGIVTLMMSPENVGLRAVLGLLALYPIAAGLFGEDLLALGLGMGGSQQSPTASPPLTKVSQAPGQTTLPRPARLHWFSHGAGSKAA